MKKAFMALLTAVIILSLSSSLIAQSFSKDITKVDVGQTKEEVESVMGPPEATKNVDGISMSMWNVSTDNIAAILIGYGKDGKVAMASFFGDTLTQIVQAAVKEGITFSESERESGLIGHTDLGRRLAEKWRLPASISAGIGFHHKLSPQNRLTLPRHLHPMADIIALADIICRRCRIGNGGDEIVPVPDRGLLERLNLTHLSLATVQDQVPRVIDRSRAFLELLE